MYPMYYGFGMDPAYLALVIISLVLGGLTQSYINSTYRKWSRVPSGGETGEQVARRMLDSLGCGRVGIRGVSGHLTTTTTRATTICTCRARTFPAALSQASPWRAMRRATPPSASTAMP